MSHAIVVFSGGMDSTVLAYFAAGLHDEVDLVSVDYGQRHKRELEFASRTADALGARHDIVDLSSFGGLLVGSALTDDINVPHGHYAADNMRTTVVPNRNALLISSAYAVAVARDASHVLVGVHAGDHHVYPDCRPEFVDALSTALRIGNDDYADVVLDAPFVTHSKTDICRLGGRLGVPFENTWSCYEGGEQHCGRCGTCVERIEAFRDAGVPDPTPYEDPSFASYTLAVGTTS